LLSFFQEANRTAITNRIQKRKTAFFIYTLLFYLYNGDTTLENTTAYSGIAKREWRMVKNGVVEKKLGAREP
jgi:hypothetical protein